MRRNTLASAVGFAVTSQARYSNTLTGLIPTVYQAFDIVARELVGFIPASTRDSTAERVAVNQTTTFPISRAATAEDVTPAVTPPNTGDQTFDTDTLTITKSRAVPFRWTGEEEKSLSSAVGGITRERLQADQIAQAMRTLCNEMEADLWAAAYKAASRAYGTAGTSPFGTAGDLSDTANLKKILDDNGAPRSGRKLVLGTTAMASINSKQSSLFKVNEAGTDQLLREGLLGRLQGFDVGDSAAVASVTKGTGAGYLVNNVAGYAVGDTSIAVDTGTGTILAGDVVTFAGDTNKYVVKTALTGGSIVLQEPGLRQTLADGVALTVGNSATQNVALHQNALVLVTRAPALPKEGDGAADRIQVTDPNSGIVFELALYKLYRMVRYEISAAWGVKATNGKFIANLLG